MSDTEWLSKTLTSSHLDSSPRILTSNYCYGEIRLDKNITLQLYGVSPRREFDSNWKKLAHDAFGLVILMDNLRGDPLADLDMCIGEFYELICDVPCVVAIDHMDARQVPAIENYIEHLELRGLICPVISIDAQDRNQYLLILDLLLLQLEALKQARD